MKNPVSALLLTVVSALTLAGGCDQAAGPTDSAMELSADSDRLANAGGLCGAGPLSDPYAAEEGEEEEGGGEESGSGECVLECVITGYLESGPTWMCLTVTPEGVEEESLMLEPIDEPACVDLTESDGERRYYSPGAEATHLEAFYVCEGGEWVPSMGPS